MRNVSVCCRKWKPLLEKYHNCKNVSNANNFMVDCVLVLYIRWTRWNEDNTSKNKLFSQLVSAMAVLKRYLEFVIYRCWRIFDVYIHIYITIYIYIYIYIYTDIDTDIYRERERERVITVKKTTYLDEKCFRLTSLSIYFIYIYNWL